MKRLFSLAAILVALPIGASAATSQFYPPPAPGGENGYWVPYSHEFTKSDAAPIEEPWVDAPIRFETILSNCDHATAVLHWSDDLSMKSGPSQIPIDNRGNYEFAIGTSNHDLGLFARHGISFKGGTAADGTSCKFFVSGERWIPKSSQH